MASLRNNNHEGFIILDKRRWYVVCGYPDRTQFEDDTIWTISNDLETAGWNTDCACTGYGLTRADAEFLVEAANYRERHGILIEASNL